MQLTEAVTLFLNYLKFEKHYSQHTLIAYEADLGQFSFFAEKQFEVTGLQEVIAIHVRTWLANMKDDGISGRSINRKLSSLKSFYKYQLRTGGVKTSPLGTVSGPKSGKKLPAWLETSQTQQLKHRDFYPEGWEGSIAHLAISILYEAGLRRSELIGLSGSQVDFHNSTIRVLGKGKKERILPVNQALLSLIKEYLGEKEKLGLGVSGPLLVKEDGKPVNASWVYSTVTLYLGMVTTQEKRSPHVLRHSFATHLTNAGADLNAVKELLGHSSLAATQVYTHNSIDKLKKVHGQAHPKG
jgi:integrase/recombinase XerC